MKPVDAGVFYGHEDFGLSPHRQDEPGHGRDDPGDVAPMPAKAFSTDIAAEVLGFADRAIRAGRKIALCTLVEIRGGSSRALGAHMAVADDGFYCGYVSGGCTEGAVAAEALQAISAGHDRFVMLGEGSPFFDIVLPCGGGITVAIHILRDPTPIASVIACLEGRRAAGLSYVPGHEQVVLRDAERGEGPDTGWHEDAFLTCYRPAVRIVLSGRILEVEMVSKVARAAGYDIVFHDPASAMPFDAALIDADTAIALLQHDLELETPVLDAALRARPFYIGALGSARTHEKRVERLRARGHSAEAIARIKAPIGLFGKARDAQSLAISIIADIAACRQAARSSS